MLGVMGLAQLKKPPQGQIYVRHQSHDRRRVTNARRHIGKNHFATIGLRQGDQFLQTDPIGSKDDLDLYDYVADDPVNKSDPTGLHLDENKWRTIDIVAGDNGGQNVPPANRSPYPSRQSPSEPKIDPNFKPGPDTVGLGDPGHIDAIPNLLGAIQDDARLHNDLDTISLTADFHRMEKAGYKATVDTEMFSATKKGMFGNEQNNALITQVVRFNDLNHTGFAILPSFTPDGIGPVMFKFTGIGANQSYTRDNIHYTNLYKYPPYLYIH